LEAKKKRKEKSRPKARNLTLPKTFNQVFVNLSEPTYTKNKEKRKKKWQYDTLACKNQSWHCIDHVFEKLGRNHRYGNLPSPQKSKELLAFKDFSKKTCLNVWHSCRKRGPILRIMLGKSLSFFFFLLSFLRLLVLLTMYPARNEFKKNLGVDKKDFTAIEFLLRKGQRQLELYASPGIRNIQR
jgi:hypothetical protein